MEIILRLNEIPPDLMEYFEPVVFTKSAVFKISTEPCPEAHFAKFPAKLIEIPIKAGCPPGGIVLDPFAGTGTTIIVAMQLKRKYIGIDLGEKYIKIINKQIEQTKKQYRFIL